jgi:hypothetical protein
VFDLRRRAKVVRKPLAILAFLSMALLATAALAQPVEDPPTGPEPRQYVMEEDHPLGRYIRPKYPFMKGPDEPPGDNPYLITEPLYPERRGTAYNQSVASSQGMTAVGSSSVSPSALTGPGAILAAPRGSGSARSSHQDARRGLKKVIRQLG